MTPEEIAAAEAAKIAANPPADPAKANQGETPEQLKERLDKIEKSYDELRSAYNKRDKEIEELRKSKDGTQNEPTQEEIREKDRNYLKQLGFMSNAEVEAEIKRRDEERERNGKIQERANQIRTGVKDLMEKHDFVKEDELLDFMKDRPGLSPAEAAKLKYEEQFDALKHPKTPNAPETDTPGKGGMEPQVKKIRKFSDRLGMSNSIRETVKGAAEVK